MSRKYIYQKFLLLNCYEKVELSNIPIFNGDLDTVFYIDFEYSLFDVDGRVQRKIQIEELDNRIDTEEEWMEFTKKLEFVDDLILQVNSLTSRNPIIRDYRQATIRAYIFLLAKIDDLKIYLSPQNNM